MSNLQHVMKGVMRDFNIRNPDLFHTFNATRPTKKFLLGNYRWWTRKIGYEDYHTPYVGFWVFGIVLLFEFGAVWFFYGTKPLLSKQGLNQTYHSLPFLWASKTNPDTHFSQLYETYTNDRLYGLRQLPKRPWEQFKDPENTMLRVAYKHNRTNNNHI